MSKIITVFGATGNQGGSVINELLKNGKFKIRAITRNPESENSKHLKEKGIEIVKCDFIDPIEKIENAIKGSYGVFLVTASFSLLDKESIYGKKIVDASINVGVKQFIFSSLPPMKKITNGNISLPEFDLKYEIEEYIKSKSSNNPSFISTFIIPPFFMQGFNQNDPLFLIKKNENDQNYYLNIAVDPNSKYPFDLVDITDMGKIVLEILNNDPSKYSNKTILLNGDKLTSNDICKEISKQTGKNVKLHYIPPDEYSKSNLPYAADVAPMLKFTNNYDFLDTDKSNQILGNKIIKLTKFNEYLKKNPIKLN